jgi:hypothetical protein
MDIRHPMDNFVTCVQGWHTETTPISSFKSLQTPFSPPHTAPTHRAAHFATGFVLQTTLFFHGASIPFRRTPVSSSSCRAATQGSGSSRGGRRAKQSAHMPRQSRVAELLPVVFVWFYDGWLTRCCPGVFLAADHVCKGWAAGR